MCIQYIPYIYIGSKCRCVRIKYSTFTSRFTILTKLQATSVAQLSLVKKISRACNYVNMYIYNTYVRFTHAYFLWIVSLHMKTHRNYECINYIYIFLLLFFFFFLLIFYILLLRKLLFYFFIYVTILITYVCCLTHASWRTTSNYISIYILILHTHLCTLLL